MENHLCFDSTVVAKDDISADKGQFEMGEQGKVIMWSAGAAIQEGPPGAVKLTIDGKAKPHWVSRADIGSVMLYKHKIIMPSPSDEASAIVEEGKRRSAERAAERTAAASKEVEEDLEDEDGDHAQQETEPAEADEDELKGSEEETAVEPNEAFKKACSMRRLCPAEVMMRPDVDFVLELTDGPTVKFELIQPTENDKKATEDLAAKLESAPEGGPFALVVKIPRESQGRAYRARLNGDGIKFSLVYELEEKKGSGQWEPSNSFTYEKCAEDGYPSLKQLGDMAPDKARFIGAIGLKPALGAGGGTGMPDLRGGQQVRPRLKISAGLGTGGRR